MGTALSTIELAQKNFIAPIEAQIASALPPTITREQFATGFITAIQRNPDLLKCDPDSLRNALIDCAADGLLPNNKQAALVPFNEKGKPRKQVQYMPMVQGIISRAHEMGEAVTFNAQCVYENDEIDFTENDIRMEAMHHRRPMPMTKPRGDLVGVYVFILDKNGKTLHREIMNRDEIDAARKVSKAKNSPAWENWLGEMAKKTVIRRASKYIPLSNDFRRIIERGDEMVSFANAAKDLPKGYNPMLGESEPIADVDTTPLPDLLPGLLAEWARVLFDATDAKTFKAIADKFWQENQARGEEEAAKDKTLAQRCEKVRQAHIARVTFKKTREEVEALLREIVGIDPDFVAAQEGSQEEGDQPSEESEPGKEAEENSESEAPEDQDSEKKISENNVEEDQPESDIPEHPEDAAEYEAYAIDKANRAAKGEISADALQAWWASAAEKKLRNNCNLEPERRDWLKAVIDGTAKALREGKQGKEAIAKIKRPSLA